MLRILTCILGCFFGYFVSFGQNQLIQTNNVNGAALNISELSDLQHLQSLGYFTEHHLLSDFTLSNAFSDNMFDIQIPNIECGYLSFKPKDIAYESENSYKVYAIIVPNEQCSDFDGEMMLVATSNGKIGYLNIDTITYEINQLGDSKLVLSKVDEFYFEDSHCGIASFTDGQSIIPNQSDPKSQERTPPFGYGNCKVRCLILYTSAASSREGNNLMIKIDKAKSQTEQALRNSEVSKNELSVEWLGPDSIAFVETNDDDDDIDALTIDSQVIELRNRYLADIVIVLTNGAYGGVSGTVRRIGPSAADPVALVNVDHMTSGRYTFAHEFAYLFGAGHETDPRSGIPHGHEWRRYKWFGKKSRSIMHTANKNPKRVLHYSNPSVSAFGDRTGRTGRRDNAEVLRQGACPVATFLPEPDFQPFSSYIVGKLKECLCQTATFSIRTYGGDPGAVSTEWFTSYNGFDYTLVGSGEFYYYNLPCPFPSDQLPAGAPNKVFLKSVSTSPDGQKFTDFHRLDFLNLDEDECSFRREISDKGHGFGIQLYPNPISQQSLSIQLDDPLICDNIHIKVLNTSGELMMDQAQFSSTGTQLIHMNVATLEKGVYFVYVQCVGGSHSEGITFVKI